MQQSRFNQMSTSIIGRIDEMGTRIDDLEKSIGELMQQVNKTLRYQCPFIYAPSDRMLSSIKRFIIFFRRQAGIDPNTAVVPEETRK